MDRWLAAWLQFLILIPSAVSCYLAMKNQLRFTPWRTLLMCGGVLVAYSLLAASLCAWFRLDDANTVLLPSMIPLFLAYRWTLRCSVAKCLAVFVGVCAMQTFPAQFAMAFDAFMHPNMDVAVLSVSGAVFQLGLASILAAAYAWPELRWFYRMVDRLDISRVWYATTGISAMFLAANILAVPQFYGTLRVARIPYLYPILEGFAFAVLAVIYLIFYYGTSIVLENAQLREENRLLEMQGRQYQILQAYLQRTARLRHDFRHSVRLLSGLAEQGDTQALREHLAQYVTRLEEESPRRYCINPALNALFAYYHAAAAAADIETDWQIEIPDPLPVDELDLAALFGNLIENAIEGCRGAAAGSRYFSLISEMQHGARLYVVSTNSFDGHVLAREDGFDSTKHAGSGLGLASVDAIARKYDGSVRAGSTGNEFHVDVMLRIPAGEAPPGRQDLNST